MHKFVHVHVYVCGCRGAGGRACTNNSLGQTNEACFLVTETYKLTVITQCLRPNTSYLQPGPILIGSPSNLSSQKVVFFLHHPVN